MHKPGIWFIKMLMWDNIRLYWTVFFTGLSSTTCLNLQAFTFPTLYSHNSSRLPRWFSTEIHQWVSSTKSNSGMRPIPPPSHKPPFILSDLIFHLEINELPVTSKGGMYLSARVVATRAQNKCNPWRNRCAPAGQPWINPHPSFSNPSAYFQLLINPFLTRSKHARG